MAILKALKGGKSLSSAIRYAAKEGHVIGKDCADDPARALDEMNAVKKSWDQTDGRSHKHYVLSFAKDEIGIDSALEIAEKLVAEAFPGHQVFLGGHEGTGKNHVHIVVNSVNLETGQKLHLDDRDLERFKSINDELCKERGLSVIDRSQKSERSQGKARTYNMAEYQLAKKGQSHAQTLEVKIMVALKESAGRGRADFEERLKAQNISVDFSRSRNDISFCDESAPSKTGKRRNSRGSKLAEKTGNEFFSRENLEMVLFGQKEINERSEQHEQRRNRAKDDRNITAEPPPERRGHLHHVSEVDMVSNVRHVSDVLLLNDASRDVRQQQTVDSNHELQRDGDRVTEPPHIALYQRLAAKGMDDQIIVRAMRQQKIAPDKIKDAITECSTKCPPRSDHAAKYVKDLISLADKALVSKGVTRPTGAGGRGGLGGDSRRAERPRVDDRPVAPVGGGFELKIGLDRDAQIKELMSETGMSREQAERIIAPD